MAEMRDIERLEKKIANISDVLERRIEGLERFADQVFSDINQLREDTHKKLKELENRISDIEDLQLLTRIEVIKMKEFLEKTPLGGFSETLEPKIDFIEEKLNNIERKLEGGITISNNGSSEKLVELDDVKNEIEKLKKEIQNIRKETNESVEKLSKIIKKLVENL